ncbi:Transmembrane domain-containing protein [Orpheovirus IHUMI-LCC2]|uniref:Transmembrane domain-containing protein n=1 Tax=Orpheovirus IHUMI-LCC2 TaxID=2023057 RepID=A0A2I2L5P6_9VIRU|nr:Transmembrane domain-containing protein [Orpheovirus IHUMI-LCC2]SNW62820.1 Transmembrane domain-containing protein [Orpheovirus IHUMI-LCC2]
MSTISTVSLIIGVASLALFIGVGAYIIYLFSQSLAVPTWAWILLIIGFLFALIGIILYFVYRPRVVVPVVATPTTVSPQPLAYYNPQQVVAGVNPYLPGVTPGAVYNYV